MRFTALALLLLTSIVFGEPTFTENPDHPAYATGAVKPLTAEEKKLEAEYLKKSEAEGWTFDFDVRQIGKHPTGLVKPLFAEIDQDFGVSLTPVTGELLKSTSLEDFGIALPPTKNQANCGSCVYFATTWGFEAVNWLYGNPTPILSPKYLMNYSGAGMKCNGAWASGDSGVANGLVRLGGLCSEADYPYKQPYESGKAPANVVLHGAIKGYAEIDPTPEQALVWLSKRTPILITVSANGPFQSYSSGVLNACQQTATNHEVVIMGLDCETSVNADGSCKFDAKGNLPPGVGVWTIQNSWGESYGERGRIRMKVTDKSGRKCNRAAEEMVILDTGLELKPRDPVTFTIETDQVVQVVTVQPKAPFTAAKAEIVLRNKLKLVEGVK